MQYFEKRYYDPTIGRFTTQDPVFWEVGFTKRPAQYFLDPKSDFASVFLIVGVFFSLRQGSYINEQDALESAKEIMLRYNDTCGGGFEKSIMLDTESPSYGPGFDGAWYTFSSNNWRCTMYISIYKYWGGYSYALDPHGEE